MAWISCLAAVAALQAGQVWALGEGLPPLGGGAQSMDRPSAYPPPLPNPPPPEAFSLPPLPQTPAEQPAADGRVFVKRIVFSGNTVFSDGQLRALVQGYEGREVSVAELEELRQRLTRYYINDGCDVDGGCADAERLGRGYINSGVTIPEDGLDRDGVLRFNIVEGRTSEVRVSGQDGPAAAYLEKRLGEGGLLNRQALEDRFQTLLSDSLIRQMNGRILPGARPGEGVLDVAVDRAHPYRLGVFTDNYRPPSIGSQAFGVSGGISYFPGLADTLDFTYLNSPGSNRYTGGFNLPVPLGDWGTTAFFRFDEGDSTVIEAPANRLAIKSQVHNLEGGFSRPLVNHWDRRLDLGLLLAVRENETTLLGRPFSFVPGVPGGRNQATVWRIFQNYNQLWGRRHALALRSTFSVGMDALGATPPTRGQYPSSEFFAWLGQWQYAFRLGEDGADQVVFRGAAQFSNAPLLPLERFAAGGVGSVRGYRENYRVRDEGYSLSLEYRHRLLAGANGQYHLAVLPFIDHGKAWNHAAPYNRGEDDSPLLSVGLGLEGRFKPLSAEFYYGYAVITPNPKTSGNLQDDGLHFQVRLDMLDLLDVLGNPQK